MMHKDKYVMQLRDKTVAPDFQHFKDITELRVN